MPAHAGWPVPRGDKARTGTTAGHSDLEKPVPYWRYYLGGSVGPQGARILDVDHDGEGEVVIVSGGQLVARRRNNELVWATPVVGITSIDTLADFDGDGQVEIAAHSGRQVFLIQRGTGRVLWESPVDDFGTIGGVRAGDLDGDGKSDLFAQDCVCCRVTTGKTGHGYSFAGGFPAARTLWTLPTATCGGYKSMAIVDVDGDGRAEVTLGDSNRIRILDGATGRQRAITADLGQFVGGSQCQPVDVDGNGDDELVCVQNDHPVGQPELGHRVFVLDYHSVIGPDRLDVTWLRAIGEQSHAVLPAPRFIADLDGDGSIEIAISGALTAGDRPVTDILDAATGAVLVELAGQRVVGVVRMRAGGPAMIVTDDQGTLHGWSFTRQGGLGSLIDRWSLGDRSVMSEPSWDELATIHAGRRLVAGDITGDGSAELVLRGIADPSQIFVYDMTGGQPREVGRYSAGQSHTILAAFTAGLASDPAGGPPGEKGELLVAPSHGIMQVVDRKLQPVDFGVRFGGYYPRGDWRNLQMTPVVADLGGGGDSVLVADSSGALVRLDDRDASLAVKLDATWRIPGTTSPIIVPGLAGGEPGIACRQNAPAGGHRVTVLDPAGAERWSADVGGDVLSDIVPASLPGDTTPDLIVEWGRPFDSVLEHRAYSGATGQVLWNAAPHDAGGARFPAGGSVADWNRDGVDDFLYQFYDTRVLSGVNGAVLAQTPAEELPYFMPTVADIDRDGKNEVILHASFYPVRVLDDNLTTVMWKSTATDRPYPYGAVVTTCLDDVARLVEGSLMRPARLEITALGGNQLGSKNEVVLASGQAFSSEDGAIAAGARMGQLTSTSVHLDLAGDGLPVAVVGSEDGWLYAVDACSGGLRFAVPMHASVGAVAFGDTNGDGRDEIITATADGYLYVLREAPVAAPAWIIDLDPRRTTPIDASGDASGDVASQDIDLTTETGVLVAAWQPVAEADSYEVAAIRAESNEFVSDPPWQAVGKATQARLTSLALKDGERYTFIVRALKDGGRSPDAASDGLVVDVPGLAGGCGCRVSGSDRARGRDGLLSGLILVLGLFISLRRRPGRLLAR